MGSTSNKQQQHQERANLASTQDLQQLQNARQISDRLYLITKNIYEHCLKQQFDQLANDFKVLTYDIPISHEPLCLKRTKRYYICQTCLSPPQVIVCEDCFQIHKHSDHKYTLLETSYPRTCSCGNSEMPDSVSCQTHSLSQVIIKEQVVRLFNKELKYLVRLALPLAEKHPDVHISEKFRNSFVFHLLTFIKNVSKNNSNIAELLEDIFFTESQFSQGGETIFQEMISLQVEQVNATMIIDIMSALVKSKCRKDRLTDLYFKWLLSTDESSLVLLKIFKDSSFIPSSFPNTYLKYFQKPLSGRFFLFPLDTKNLDFVWQKHEKFAKEVGQILFHPNRDYLLVQIFHKTGFTQFLDFQSYYLANNEANQNINKINLHFSLLAFRIIRILASSEVGLRLLRNNLPSLYQKISIKKTITFDRSLQRSFSLIVFLVMQFNLPTKSQLQKLLKRQLPTTAINRLIIQSIDFKNSFTSEYHDLIEKGEGLKLQGNIRFPLADLVAADELFVKILANCLSQPNIFKQYIETKLCSEQVIVELCNKNIREPLRKLPQLFKYFEVPLQNKMAQMLLSANSKKNGKQSEIVLYSLLIGYENILSGKFKTITDQFIAYQGMIVEFIKNQAVIQNKRIKAKANPNLPFLSLSPDSEYYFEALDNQAIEKLVQNKFNKVEVDQQYKKIFNAESLKLCLQIWENCANVIQSGNFDAKKHEKELISTLLTLSNLYFSTKLPVLRQIIQKLGNKLPSSHSKIQIYLKYILQAKSAEEKERQKPPSVKKKQMLIALKQKQRSALQSYMLQEKCQIDLECIFCKNSIEGQPYLLGHFKYNNFYSKKIFQVNTPFMEFTTCGHSAHEKCLIQMHKGDFRIWYPCILCKSITNILLPIGNSQLNEEKRLEKILDFLKNFAANYTFFFQSNKQLVEFDLNDIIGVYKLLFKTMAYSLTIYPIANFSYFERSQLPILKFIFDLLLFSFKKLRNLSFGGQYLQIKGNNDFTNIFNYHKFQLQALITGNQHSLSLQRKIDLHRDRIPEELTHLFDQVYEYFSDERDRIDYQPKEVQYKEAIKVLIIKPPQDLKDLRKLNAKCSSCLSRDQNFQICALCEWSCCSACKDMRKVHALEMHLGETVFLSGFNGKYTYIHEELTGEFNSIYVDYLGQEADDKVLILAQEFLLSENGWAKIVNDVICNRLHKQIMRSHA